MTTPSNDMTTRATTGGGFIAALDQSGGSTPGALRQYGIEESSYSGDQEMYRLMHEMRVRIMSAPAFTGEKVIGAILFERTMDGDAHGKPVPTFLWEDRGVVPYLKVDKGLESETGRRSADEADPRSRCKLLARAVKRGIYGTKMRSVINAPNAAGVEAIVTQQFEVAAPDRETRADANHRTRSVDQVRRQEGLRSLAARSRSRRISMRSRRIAR